MYQRMLDKRTTPTIEGMKSFCGESAELFSFLNGWLTADMKTVQKIVFPYGNHYGWGVCHRKGNKLICNVFPEDNAFTVMLRLSNGQWNAIYDKTQTYMREYIDHKYPCSDGGWIHYRVTCPEQLDDIKAALELRCETVFARE